MSGKDKAAPIALIPKCPHCGRRDTFEQIGYFNIMQTHTEVRKYKCTSCSFQWVTIRRKLDEGKGGAGVKAKLIAYPPDPVGTQRERIRIVWQRRMEIFHTDTPTVEQVADIAQSTVKLAGKVLAEIKGGNNV